MANETRSGRLDLDAVKASMEATDEGVFYLGVGAFDVRLCLAQGRLTVKVFEFGSVGEALAECEACDPNTAGPPAGERGHG